MWNSIYTRFQNRRPGLESLWLVMLVPRNASYSLGWVPAPGQQAHIWSFFFSFIQQDLLDEDDEQIGLGQKDALRKKSLTALAGKTPQPTPALSRSTTADVAIGTPQRVSNLRKSCLIRDRYPCVITRRFDAQEAQNRYKRSGRDARDDDGESLLPERDIMAYLESLTGEGGDRKLIAHRVLTMLFGNFEIAFEPVGTQLHTYKVDYVESDRMGRVEKLPVTVRLFLTPDRSVDPPSPQLLAIHAGDEGEILQNGSTRVDDYVWFRLRETSVY
ncbi:hypothetical protein BDW75DRAFT_232062 [Aspergillus navahoensis]